MSDGHFGTTRPASGAAAYAARGHGVTHRTLGRPGPAGTGAYAQAPIRCGHRGLADLAEDETLRIRTYVAHGLDLIEIAEMFGTTRAVVHDLAALPWPP